MFSMNCIEPIHSVLTLGSLLHPTLGAQIINIQYGIVNELILVAASYGDENALAVGSKSRNEGQGGICSEKRVDFDCTV